MRTLLAVVALCLTAPAAAAQTTIYAGPPSTYLTPHVTIDAGETVTFTNLDLLGHDVFAVDRAPDGTPLFKSEIVAAGGSSEVAGAEELGGGTFGFICSIHPQMTGTLTVEGPPASDTSAPSVALSVLDSRIAQVRRRRALRVRVEASEPSTVDIAAEAGRRSMASGTYTVSGTRTVAVRLTAAGRRTIRRARRVEVEVSALASDAAGNRASAGASRTLR